MVRVIACDGAGVRAVDDKVLILELCCREKVSKPAALAADPSRGSYLLRRPGISHQTTQPTPIVPRPMKLSIGLRATVRMVIANTVTRKAAGTQGQPGTGSRSPSRRRSTINPNTVAAVLSPSVKPI